MKTKTNSLAALMLLATATLGLGQTNFTQVSDSVPVKDVFDAAGCAFVDYDNDGYVDLFVANFSGNNRLYHNERNGTFKAITAGDIVNEGANESYAVAWGDFDNDGFSDLFVGNGYGSGKRNFLYHNNGDGTFTKITSGAIATTTVYSSGCAWADYDRDGFIDLFVANHPGASLLYHNEGGLTFTGINSIPSVASDAGGVAWSDFNNDGLPDLFVANGFSTTSSANWVNFLYSNLGNGKFQRVPALDFPSARQQSVGIAWGDYDNDGFPDVFVANDGNSPEKNELYHNNGNGTFTRITTGSIVNDQSYSIAPTWGDYDNDGWLDLFVGNRTYDYNAPQPSFLYHNNGDGTFTRITVEPIAEYTGSNGGCAWGDYDNDGFLDLFVSSLAVQDGGRNALFHNTANSNHWLKVNCVGTVSNRSAIGAKVRVHATIGGKTFWQLREISSGDGFGSSALIAHFGLGDATNIDTVRIEWPSGSVQVMTNVTLQQSLTVTEPPVLKAVGTLPDGSFQLSLTGGVGFSYDVQTSGDLAGWSFLAALTNTNRTMSVIDTTATNRAQRFYRALSR